MTTRNRLIGLTVTLLVILLGAIALDNLLPALSLLPALALPDLAQNYVTVFLGIFIEAIPFLLLGTVVSGLIAVFVSADDIARFVPRNKILATVMGALLGMIFPVCECGVVPVTRRLYQKGFPISAGVAFLLGAPVLNPIVIASTYAAFGIGPILWSRIGFTFLIAVGVGMVFLAQPNAVKVLRPLTIAPMVAGGADHDIDIISVSEIQVDTFARKLQRALGVAADEFFDMARYLIAGALIATTLQTFVPQPALAGIGGGLATSVLALSALAFALSVCSTVDAFLALSFVNTFTAGAIIAFLVFGPMVDIKSSLMFLGVFRRRVVVYLILLPLLGGLAVGLFVNFNLAW
ncbi:MAG: permease [Candidatus Roseilinea sp.]|uniref:permease n=1 Tax=Candidatus Roseilinea sp. TaxID=2838777 RepID=UPI00404AA07E